MTSRWHSGKKKKAMDFAKKLEITLFLSKDGGTNRKVGKRSETPPTVEWEQVLGSLDKILMEGEMAAWKRPKLFRRR